MEDRPKDWVRRQAGTALVYMLAFPLIAVGWRLAERHLSDYFPAKLVTYDSELIVLSGTPEPQPGGRTVLVLDRSVGAQSVTPKRNEVVERNQDRVEIVGVDGLIPSGTRHVQLAGTLRHSDGSAALTPLILDASALHESYRSR
ncbi:hypothetical protein KPL74_05045 [Bacillus sp. NP157]|nr:hypothetical protein KPL74_05045 [Bacillus sp. NP157]